MPVTAPCSAARTMAAVRALQTAIATPSTYGLHIPRVLPTPMTGDYTKACLFIPVTTSIPTPLVCAVSWMRIILQKILQIFFDVWSGYGTLQCFGVQTAARALMKATATRTLYGRALRIPQRARAIMGTIWTREYFTLTRINLILPALMVCAVSWSWNFRNIHCGQTL